MAENNTNTTEDPVVSALQERLTTQSEKVSSASSGVEKAISGAIASTQAGTEAETARIESQFGRAITGEFRAGQDRVQNFSEGRGGFATQITGLRKLVETTDKNLNDLEQRKQELILQNNSAGAAKISELQLAELTFKQQSEQQVFDNLLKESSFGLQQASFEEGQRQFDLSFDFEGEKFQLQKDQQSFAEQQAMGQIALEFGLQVAENDTISAVIARAAKTGIVDERRAAELRQIEASINASNATTAKALQGIKDSNPFDQLTSDSLAKAYRNGRTEFLADLTGDQRQGVLKSIQATEKTERETISSLAESSGSEEDFFTNIESIKTNLSETERALIDQYAVQVANDTTFDVAARGKFFRAPDQSLAPKLISGSQILKALGAFSQVPR